jgi:HEAT repeat protein
MRPLSDSTLALIQAVQRRRGLLARVFGDDRDDVATFDHIVAQPEPAVVPWLLPFAFGEQGERASAALRALSACIAVAAPLDLLELDEECRRRWWYVDDAGPRAEVAIDGAILADPSGDPTRAIGVLSFHPNGRVRERAVQQLSTITSGLELPFLLIRLNDWVDVVARRAETAVQRRVVPPNAEEFVVQLPIVLRLETRRRRQHGMLIDALLAMLLEPASQSALRRGLESADRRVRRRLFRAALAARPSDDALIERALSDEDTVIRVEAARHAHRDLSSESLKRVVSRLLKDPYPRVRAEGLTAVAKRGMPDVDSVLSGALFDRSRMVRELARFHLRQYRQFDDFRSVYRERIAKVSMRTGHERTLASAIIGLGETGRPEDELVLLPFLEDERPTIRVAGARALAMLDIDRWLDRLVEMLSDSSSIVTRRVRHAIEPRAGSVSLESLRRQIAEGVFTHGRLDSVLLARELGKWDAIVLFVESLLDREASVRDAALEGLRRWLMNWNSSFERPTAAHARLLRSVVDKARAALEPMGLGDLDNEVLRYWDQSQSDRNTTRREI